MSDVQPSIDPIPILLEPGERSPLDKSVAAGLVGLVYLARQAFEEKRQKQCLEITKAILKIEPEHAEARTIQDSVRCDLDREFANAHAVARDAQSKNDRILYRRATAALRRIVDADPDNLEAQTLFRETVAAGYFSSSSGTGPSAWTARRRFIVIGSVAFVVLVAVLALMNGAVSQVSAQLRATTAVSPKSEPQKNSGSFGRLDLPAVPEPGAPMTLDPAPASSLPTSIELRPETPRLSFSADGYRPPTAAETALAGDRRTVSVAAAASPSRAAMPPAPGGIAAASTMGALAVSAAVPVEIYRGEEHLGSTPTTLQLPAGTQALEYRYQGLRQTVTHVITAQGTSTATISFPIKVQINAKPWAQVFVEGARLTPIGQTPLGDVSLPIGSVLVFRNPGFPDKRYRVTASDAAIQMTFP